MKGIIIGLKIGAMILLTTLLILAMIYAYRDAERGIPFLVLVCIFEYVVYCAFTDTHDYKKRDKNDKE
jgi:ABC-type amino acid transport system permease subunit